MSLLVLSDSSDKHLVLVAVLDPRLKPNGLLEMVQWAIDSQRFANCCVKEAECSGCRHSHWGQQRSQEGAHFGSYESNSSVADSARGQMEEYLGSMRKSPQEDVLGFWKTSSRSLPRLAKVTQHNFSIPSGSSSAERVFSAAGLLSGHTKWAWSLTLCPS